MNNNLGTIINNSECVLLSLIIVSSCIVNVNTDSKPEILENVALLNISYTDSYTQNLSTKFNSLYSNTNSKLIFPICIFKNNIYKTLKSTGNLNRLIHNDIFDGLSNYKINIMLNNIKNNIPRQNYILANEPILIFENLCRELGLECIYKINLTTINGLDYDFTNTLTKLIEEIENKYSIKTTTLTEKHNLSTQSIQYLKQNGLANIMFDKKKRTSSQTDL